MKDCLNYLEFIVECIDDIYAFIDEDQESFLSDKKTQYAVIRAMQILAESTQRLPPELKAEYPEVEWRGIAGFRNVIVHDYFGLNPLRVWEIIEGDLPLLETVIGKMIVKMKD